MNITALIALIAALVDAGSQVYKGVKEANYEKKAEKYRKKQEADLKKQEVFRRKQALRGALESRKAGQLYRHTPGSLPWDAPKRPDLSTANIIGGSAGALGSLAGGISDMYGNYGGSDIYSPIQSNEPYDIF